MAHLMMATAGTDPLKEDEILGITQSARKTKKADR
jgi:hypothetical protein